MFVMMMKLVKKPELLDVKSHLGLLGPELFHYRQPDRGWKGNLDWEVAEVDQVDSRDTPGQLKRWQTAEGNTHQHHLHFFPGKQFY
jgi:hypothetical protein